MAWANNVLRVNLTDGTTSNEPLNMEWARRYLGQRGLATKYLSEEIDPGCDALGPDNKLIVTTGPLTGTMASTGGRYSVVTKSPLTGAVACSNSGGFIGTELKAAGYDMIIFEGKSPRPVYLYVENDKVEIVSAEELWGQSVWATDEWLHKKYQDPLLRIAAVRAAAPRRAACTRRSSTTCTARPGAPASVRSWPPRTSRPLRSGAPRAWATSRTRALSCRQSMPASRYWPRMQ